jgi:hypothetical protein
VRLLPGLLVPEAGPEPLPMGLSAVPSQPGARGVEEAAARRSGVTIRYFDGCPNWRTILRRVVDIARDLDAGLDVSLERIESDEDAERLRFVGSPTLLLDGQDPFEVEVPSVFGLSCRIYRTPQGPAGSPTREQLREVLLTYLEADPTT